jgi:subtilase family serine protease
MSPFSSWQDRWSARRGGRRRDHQRDERPARRRARWLDWFRPIHESLEPRLLLTNQQPDLVVTAFNPPATGVEGNGSQITISYTVKNQGTAPATGDWSDAVYVSDTNGLDKNSVQIDSLDERFQTPLAVGASYTINRVVTLPQFSTGNQFLVLSTNDGGRMFESNTTNNLLAKPISLSTPNVDLAVTAATVPTSNVTAGNGQAIEVSYTVQNQGTNPANGGWEDAIYLSSKQTFDTSARFLESKYSGANLPLAAGASYTAYRTVKMPDDATGTEYLLFVTNFGQGQGESDSANETNDVLAKAITVAAPGNIDLAMTNVQVPSTTVVEGNGATVPVSYTVVNNGTQTAQSAWRDSIYLSAKNTLDSTATFLDSPAISTYQPLAGGASYSVNDNLRLPVGTSGSMFLLFQTDSGDVQGETNKANNVVAKPITIASPNVDLSVTSVTAPATAVAGPGSPTVPVSFTVKNLGTDTASGSWDDAIYISANSTFDATAHELTSFFQSAFASPGFEIPATLAGGTSYTISANVSLPTVGSGVFYLYFRTNINSGTSFDEQDETSFTNNVASQSITLSATATPTVDLSIVNGSTLPASVEEGNGTTVNLQWTVTNAGTTNTSGFWQDGAFLENDGNLTNEFGNRLYLTPTQSNLAAGSSYTVNQTVKVPAVGPGQHDLVLATDVFGGLAESTKTNNLVSVPITLTAPAVNLTVTGASVPVSEAVEGSSFDVSWTVKNTGSEAAGAGWTDAVYVSDGPSFNSDNVISVAAFAAHDQAGLAAGASYTDTERITLPGTATGLRYLLFVTNSTESQSETNPNDNVVAVPITLAAPDLATTSFVSPANFTVDQPFTISWSVRNQGGVPAPASWSDSVYLSNSPTYQGATVLSPFGPLRLAVKSESAHEGLAPGASYNDQMQLTISSSDFVSVYNRLRATSPLYLLFVADDANTQPQSDESFSFTPDSNDVYAAPIQLQAPDLKVTAATVPSSAIEGTPISVTWTVQNAGPVPAFGTWYDAVYASSNQILDSTATLVTEFPEYSQSGLGVGVSYTASQQISIPQTAVGNNRFLLFVTNFGQFFSGSQLENDGGGITPDANDVLAKSIAIEAPDLQVTAATASAASAVEGNGTKLQISYTVQNAGSVPADGSWQDSLYLSSSQTFDSTAQYLTSLNFSSEPLAAGANYSNSTSVTLPQTATGNLFLLVVTNDTRFFNSQPESDHTSSGDANNVKAIPIDITAPAVDLAVTNVAVPAANATLTAGDSVRMAFTVKNKGTDAAGGAWDDSVYFSTKPTLDNTAIFLNSKSPAISPLPGGTSYTQTLDVPLRQFGFFGSPLPPGAGYLFFVTNDRHFGATTVQDETDSANDTNDMMAVPVTIAAPDLTVTTATATPTATPTAGIADTFALNYTVKNTGSVYADGTWQDNLYLSYHSTFDSTAQFVTTLNANPAELAPGGSYSLNQNVSLTSAQGGQRYLLVVANATSSQVEEDEISPPGSIDKPDPNDVFAVPVTFTAADLEVVPGSVSVNPGTSDAGGGQSVSVTYTVKNLGTLASGGSWVDQLYLSSNSTFDSTAQLVGTLDASPPALTATGGANDHYQKTAQLTLPAAAAGAHFLFVVTNASGSLAESDATGTVPDANDAQSIAFSYTSTDLSISMPQAPASAVVGNGGTIPVSYRVTSSAATTLTWTDQLFLSDHNTFDDTARLVATLDTAQPALAAGAHYDQSANVTLPIVPGGSYFLFFVTNSTVGEPESDASLGLPDANDVAMLPITLSLPKVELQVSNPSAPATAVVGNGGTIPVSATVTNVGSDTAQTSWHDAIYISNVPTLDRTATLIAEQPAVKSPLAGSGGTYTVSANVPLPVVAPGIHYLLFVTNADGVQAESDGNAALVGPDANDVKSLQITTSLPSVDLTATNGNVSSTALNSGKTANVSFTVTNAGSGAAGAAWTDAIYLSTKSAVDSSAILLTSVAAATDPLASGGHYSVSQTVTIPSTFSGAGYLILVTNANQAQSETNTSNDALALAVTVTAAPPPAPDLALGAITASPAVDSTTGQRTIAATWTVKNQGTADASGNWVDDLYLSPTATFNFSTATFVDSVTHTGGLTQNSTYVGTDTVDVPERDNGGNEFLLVIVNNGFPRLNELDNQNFATDTNNQGSQSVTIAAPDLKITAAKVTPTTALVGDAATVDVSYTVENVGSVTAGGFWSDSLYVSNKQTFDNTATLIGSFDLFNLVGGGSFTPLAPTSSYSVDQQMTIPNTATGQRFLLIVVNDGRSLGEADGAGGSDANDLSAQAVTLNLPSVDLEISNPSVPSSLVVGQSVPVQFTVTNNGSAAASADWQDAVYFSQHSTLDSSAIQLGSFFTPQTPLAAGASYNVNTSVTLSSFSTFSPIPTGAGFLLLVADDGNPPAQAETTGTHQVVAEAVTVSQPDLSVTSVSAQAAAAQNESIPVTWTVKNLASVDALGTWSDTVYLGSQPDPSDTFSLSNLGSFTHGPLAASTSYTDTESVTIPASSRTGDLWLIVITDSDSSQQGADPLTNYQSIPIHITVANADLVVSSVTAPAANSQLILGDTVPVTWVVTNQGNKAANALWHDEVFISSQSTFDAANATSVGYVSAPPAANSPLAAGANYTLTANVTLPALTTGPAYLFVETNADLAQSEIDTANDVSSAVPITLAAPELAVSGGAVNGQTAPYVASLGQTLGVTWKVTNQGGVKAPAQWYDAVYLSTKQTLDSTATLLSDFNEVAHQGLTASASYTENENVTIPKVSLGQQYLLFVTNVFGGQPESDAPPNAAADTNDVQAVPITIASPILATTSATVNGQPSPFHATLGTPFSVSWTVQDQGTVPALATWHDAVYVSNIDVLDGTAQLVNRFDESVHSGLAAGASYTDTENITLPSGLTGQRFLLFVANDGQEQPVASTANAVFAVPVTINGADLTPTSANAPSIASLGSSIAVNWTVINQGNAVASATWSDAVYFSTGTTLASPSVFAASFSAAAASPLAAGSSYTLNENVTIPNGAAGDSYLLIVTDSDAGQAESDTNNDVLALPIELTQANLTANSLSVTPTSAQFGQQVQVSWNITNNSTTALNQPWSDSIYFSSSSTFNPAQATLLDTVDESSVLPLAANASYTQTANVTLPLTATSAAGTYHLFVFADSLNQIAETNENDNVAGQSIAMSLPALPEVVPSNLTLPASGLTGQGFNVTWTDQNAGAATAVGPWRDDVYISTDQKLADGTLIGQFTYTGSLAAGAGATRTQHFNFPGTPGSYFIIIQADADGGVNEGPDAPNSTVASSTSIAVAQVPLPDLVASVQTPTVTVSSGTSVAITYTVTNQGNAPTSAPFWYDYVFVSQDPNLTFAGYNGNVFADQLINNVVVLQEHVTPVPVVNPSFLNPNQSYTQTADVTLPIDASGTWYAYVVTNGLGGHFQYRSTMAESNAANNLAVSGGFNVALSPPPDLDVAAVQAPAQAFSGQAMSLGWTVANIGSGPVPADTSTWNDQVYMSASQSLDSSAVLLGTFTHTGALAVGASYAQQQSVTLPVGVSGHFYFLVKTNADGTVFENGATANDVLSATTITNVNLTPPPDLAATSITAPATALASHTLTIAYQVTNQGAGATPNTSWTDSFYLGAGSTLNTTTDLHLGDVVHFGALPASGDPADVYASSASFTLPNGLASTFHVFVVTDSLDQVFELDKSNNTFEASNSTVVSSQPADLVVSAASAPSSALAGQPITVNWTVTNQGNGDSAVSGWTDTIYATSAATLGASATPLDVVHHHGLLAAGANYTASDQITLPISLAGNLNLFVATNTDGSVFESNANNDVSNALPITIGQQLADLTMTNVSAPATAATGASVAVSWTEKNAGTGATNSNDWYDDVYLSPTQTFNASTAVYLGSFFHNVPLAAGAADPITASFTLPQNLAAPVSDFFIVRADRPTPPFAGASGVNLVFESNETNNDGSTPTATSISAAATPDLTTTNVTPPAGNIVTGQTINVTWTVTNNAAATDPSASWNDAVYLSLDTSLDPSSDILVGNAAHSGGLAAGAHYTGSGSFQIPLGLAGKYYVIVAADAQQSVFERTGQSDRISASTSPMTIVLEPPVDLVAGTFTVPSGPTSATLGQALNVTYSVSNSSSKAAAGDWYDALYLSPTPTFQTGDPLLGEVHHQGGLTANASYSASFQATMPGVSPGVYYIILVTDIRNQVLETTKSDNLSASATVTLDAAVLTPGAPGSAVPATGTLTQGQSAFYKVTVPAGETLTLNLADSSSADANELFLSFGKLPSLSQADFQGNQPLSANQQITVPTTQAGTYYVLINAQTVASPPENYSITATLVPFSITAVRPAAVGNAGPVTIEIDGAQFNRDTTFQLIDGQGKVTAASAVEVDNASTAYATFDLTGAATGSYTVQATQSGGATSKLTGGLTVNTGTGGSFIAHVVVPSITLAGRLNVFHVTYSNTGDASVGAPLLTITTSTNTPVGLSTSDVYPNRDLNVLAIGADGPAGDLRPGTSNSVPVLFQANSTVGVPYHFEVNVTTTADQFPIDWNVIQPLVSDQYLHLPIWPTAFADLQQRIGPTWGDYVKMLDRNAALQVAETGMENSDPLALLDLEAEQAVADVSTSIRGTVHATDPSIKLGGAEVDAIDVLTGNTYGAKSLADGSFIFPQVAPGTYTITFEGAIVTSGGLVTIAQGQQLNVVLQLSAGASLAGHVRDQATGNPIANAAIDAFDAAGVQYTVSADSQGAYTLTGLPTGTYTVIASADGYAATAVPNVTVSAGTNALDFNLKVQGVITGTISLPGGQLNPGTLSVTATPTGSPPGTKPTADTQVQGLNTFTLDALPAGTYDIALSLPGFLPQMVAGVSVNAGQTVNLGNISLTASAVISGQVTSSDATLISSGVQVGAYQGSTLVASVQADSSGNFSIGNNLAAGTYTIAPTTSEFYTPQTITVTAGQNVTGVKIDVEPGGTITGTVTDAVSGATLAGVVVNATPPSGDALSTTTDSNGDYTFTGLNLGQYTVYLNHDAAAAGSQTVQITSLSGPAVQANLQLQTEGRLQGQLLTAGGAPVAGGSVQLFKPGTTTLVATTTSDDQGNYGFWFTLTGTFDIHATAEGASFLPVTGVQIATGTTVTQNLTAGTATLKVQVLANGNPAPNVDVALYFQTIYGSAPAGTFSADANGNVTFGNLAAGSYVAAAQANTGLGASATTSLATGASGSLVISLTQQAAVSGKVTDSSSNAIAGATIAVVSTTNSSQQFFARTDANGNYAITNVPFGTYNFAAVATGFEGAFVGNVSITTATATQNLTLQTSPNLVEGRVIDENKVPLAGALVEVINAQGDVVGDGQTASDGTYSIGGEAGNGLHISVTALGQTLLDPLAFNDPAGQTTPVMVPDFTFPTSNVLAQLSGLKAPSSHLTFLPQAWFEDIITKTHVLIVFPFLDPSDVEPQCEDEYNTALDAIGAAQDSAVTVVGAAGVLITDATTAEGVFAADAAKFISQVESFAKGAYKQLLTVLEVAGPAALTLAPAPGGGGTTTPTENAVKALSDILQQLATALTAAETADDALIAGVLRDGAFPPTFDDPGESGAQDSLDVALTNLDAARANAAIVVGRIESSWDALARESMNPGVQAVITSAIASLDGVSIAPKGPFDPGYAPFGASLTQFGIVNAQWEFFFEAAEAFWADDAEMIADINAYYACQNNDDDGDEDEDDEDRHMQPPPGGGDGDADGDDSNNNPNMGGPDGDSDADDQQNNNNNNNNSDNDNDNNGGGGNSDHPHDPNTIVGPQGFGDEHFVPEDQPLAYEINFENQPSAGLPAQTVTITEDLDPHLDWRTFRLGQYGWGGTTFAPRANSAAFQQTIVEPTNLGFDVQVTATVDLQTGVATWVFQTIDPATSQTPTDATKGFLPPDNSQGIGEGFVTYTISPLSTDVTGDAVKAEANVVFDTQPPINTPQIFNTLENANAITSQVTGLPAVEAGASFTVAWTGSTGTSGSAIATYSVFVSDDGGPFTTFVSSTTATSAVFSGKVGHTYAFYTLATDNTGNQQAPSSAVTVTTSVADPVTSTTAAAKVSATEGVPVSATLATFTAADPTGPVSGFVTSINWGDGTSATPGTVTAGGGIYTISGTHAFADEAASDNLTIVITDTAGTKTTVTNTANVADATLAATGATLTGTEGATASGLVATFSDANTAATASDFSATIAWGDGLSSAGTVAADPHGGFDVSGAHVYAEEGAGLSVTATIVDDGGARATAAGKANVADASLSATAAATAATEGSTFSGTVATFSDADPAAAASDFTVSVNWGDGQTSAGTVSAAAAGGGFVVTASHDFAEEHANLVVAATISDAGGATASIGDTATVADATLSASGKTIAATEGTQFTGGVATFSDSDPAGAAGDYTATVFWGDGSSSAGTVSAAAGGGFQVTGSHMYGEETSGLAMSVVIADAGSALITAIGTANVADATLSATSATVNATENSTFTGAVASFTDTDTLGTTTDFTATIHWGDGTTSTGTVSGGTTFTVSGTHTFGEEQASIPFSVVVSDVGGLAATINGSITIADATLSAQPQTIAAVEGAAFSGTVATFTDADSAAAAGNYTATVSWGDGQSSTGTVSAGANGFTVNAGHTYAEEGSHLPLTVVISDVGGAKVTAAGTANVADATLSATATATISTTEGATFSGQLATFTDADPAGAAADYAATILWGDGKSSAGSVSSAAGGGFQVTGTHVYGEEGSGLSFQVVIADAATNVTASGTANVSDASLTATSVTFTAMKGVTFHGTVADFTDADPAGAAADYSATIVWDDGTTSTGSISALSGGFAVSGSHLYTAVSSGLPLTVTMTDQGGATASATSTAVVVPALTATGNATTLAATEGAALTANLATVADGAPGATATQISATISWGDGSSAAGTLTGSGGSFTLVATHSYAEEAASHTINFTITDNVTGAVATVQDTAAVADATLSATAVSVHALPGSPLTSVVLANFSDAGGAEAAGNYTATLDWGDGTTNAGTISPAGGGGFQVTGSHSYTGATKRQVTVTIADDGGSTAHVVTPVTFGDANAQFVAAAYMDVLARPVDAAGLNYWDQQLDGGQSRTVVVNLIDHSAEYFGNIIIGPAYMHYLGRTPDATGLAYWVDQMQNHGLTDEELEAGFIASDEFYRVEGQNTDSGWVNALYEHLLGRPADSAGLTYWLGQLKAGETREQVALGFTTSLERETQRIEADYFHYLGRAADQAGLDYWVQQFKNGQTNEDLITGFVASDEYFKEHTS